MKPSTLCIVDMQKCFRAANDTTTINRVIRLIKAAKKRRAGIIVLEYMYCPRTLPCIRDVIGKYKKVAYARKPDNDGSDEVISVLLERRSFNYRRIKVCGVNTDCCVADTIKGLLQKARKTTIEVIGRACLSHEDLYNDYGDNVSTKAVEKNRRRTLRHTFSLRKRLKVKW